MVSPPSRCLQAGGTRPHGMITGKKLFGIYFGGYSENISGDFVSSFKEHSKLCDEKDGTKGRK